MAVDVLKALFSEEWGLSGSPSFSSSTSPADLISFLLFSDGHRKVFAQLLPKLYFPEDCEPAKVKEVMLLAKALRIVRPSLSSSLSPLDTSLTRVSLSPSHPQHKPLADTVSKNALSKLETSLAKRFSKDVASWAAENQDQSREVKKSVKEYLAAM